MRLFIASLAWENSGSLVLLGWPKFLFDNKGGAGPSGILPDFGSFSGFSLFFLSNLLKATVNTNILEKSKITKLYIAPLLRKIWLA